MGKSFWGIYSIGITALMGLMILRGGTGTSRLSSEELTQFNSKLERLELIESELKDLRGESEALSAELRMARESIKAVKIQSSDVLEAVGRELSRQDLRRDEPRPSIQEVQEIGVPRDDALVAAPSDVAATGLVRVQPTYVSLTPDADVEVIQGSNGAVYVKNSDPDLAFQTIEVEAVRDDGTVDILSVTAPPPAVE